VTLYDLKPRFQALLRPLVSRIARGGVTANQVTLAAAAGSIALGAGIAVNAGTAWLFALLAPWLLVRMALNAIDGMLAREFGQKTPLGAFLNELCDVVSDAALLLPFAFVAPFEPLWVAAVIFLCGLAEFAGVLGPLVGASRRYDGPLGKSDRALAVGVLGLAVAWLPALPDWLAWAMPLMAIALCVTIVNRTRAALRDLNPCITKRSVR
jgi:CDP-diacylglycerol--glycerol-3-phosphate 3-phosphatidyltransferase